MQVSDHNIAAPTAQPEHHSLFNLTDMINSAGKGMIGALNATESGAAHLAASVHLPHIDIDHTVQQAGHVASEVGNVAKEFGKGVVDEAVHHPGQLAVDAAVGLAKGVAIGAAVTVVGLVAAPEVVIGAAVLGGAALVAGAAVEGYHLYQNKDAIMHNIGAVADPEAHSAKDVADAKQAVEGFGETALRQGVGLAASIPGALLGGAAVHGIAEVASAAMAGSGSVAAGAADNTLVTTARSMAERSPGVPADAIFGPAETPFTVDQTTMSVANSSGWARTVAQNGSDAYGVDILKFTNSWATNMEAKMAAGEPMTAEMVNKAMLETPPTSGFGLGAAENELMANWKYGTELRVILEPTVEASAAPAEAAVAATTSGEAAAAAPAAAASGESAVAAPAESSVVTATESGAAKVADAAPKRLSLSMFDDEDEKFTPYTLGQTTSTMTNPEGWASAVETNGNSSYGSGILEFANGWATNMEARIAAGEPLTADMANAAEREADTMGMSGASYSFARRALIDNWKFGPELKEALIPDVAPVATTADASAANLVSSAVSKPPTW